MELSDGVEVFPGHVAGSLCGKAMSSKPSTTIGFERRFNPTLQFTEVDAFIADSASISAPKPPNLARIVDTNRGPFVGATPLTQELAAPPEGAQLLDVRPVAAHLAGHRPGAISVPVSGTSFGTKAGFVLDAASPCACWQRRSTRPSARSGASTPSPSSTSPGSCSAAETNAPSAVGVDELDVLMAAGAEVIDVREEDESRPATSPAAATSRTG